LLKLDELEAHGSATDWVPALVDVNGDKQPGSARANDNRHLRGWRSGLLLRGLICRGSWQALHVDASGDDEHLIRHLRCAPLFETLHQRVLVDAFALLRLRLAEPCWPRLAGLGRLTLRQKVLDDLAPRYLKRRLHQLDRDLDGRDSP